MSVTFRHGRTAQGKRCDFDVGMNLANGNAVILLTALGVEPNPYGLIGQLTIPEARRALIRARNVDTSGLARVPSDTKPPGKVRIIAAGCDASQLERYLVRFEDLIFHAERAGCETIEWD